MDGGAAPYHAPDDDSPVVLLLRGALARAERGELAAVALAAVHDNLSVASAWALDGVSLAEAIGAAAVLNARMVAMAMEEQAAAATNA